MVLLGKCEDDFNTIQEAYLAGNAMLSRHIGLKGAPAEASLHSLLGLRN